LAIMLVFVGRLVQVLGVLLVTRLVVRALAAPHRAMGPKQPDEGRDLVRDRVCNTFVPRERALVAVVGGREEFFCSEVCRARGLRELAASLPTP
jgi:hypothetical protein